MFWLSFNFLEGSTEIIKGQFGEDDVNRLFVYYSRKKGIHYKIMGDVHIKIANDKEMQIDTIYINKNGVFVTETKNWDGRIKGKPDDSEWIRTKTRYGVKRVYKYTNPLIQNEYHVDAVKKVLGESIPIHSLIVFASNNAAHLKINNVIGIGSLPYYLEHFESKVQLSDNEIDSVFYSIYYAFKKVS